jgi:hypothetical protein
MVVQVGDGILRKSASGRFGTSWLGSYDATKPFTITAPVETLVWAAPRADVMLKYKCATLEATRMVAER